MHLSLIIFMLNNLLSPKNIHSNEVLIKVNRQKTKEFPLKIPKLVRTKNTTVNDHSGTQYTKISNCSWPIRVNLNVHQGSFDA